MMYVIINKKGFIRLMIALLFTILIGTVVAISYKNVLLVNATPSTGKVVVIDAGHGKPDLGTQGKTGIAEQEINLEIALKLQNLLEQSGTKVYLTRSDENGIYDVDKTSIRAKKISDMNKRVDIGNYSNADLFVSIHMNYYSDSVYSGWQTFYNAKNANSKKLASCVQSALNENIKEVKRNPMAIKGNYIVDNVKITTVIVECGFLSNANDEKNLKDKDYQDKIAWGIYMGIQKYFLEE